jgi:very-short-patch-repair endonuclease
MTGAEKVFWEMVRDRRMFGLKFRRQQIIDGFIVDFYCDSLGLCVEIDGSVHDSEEQQKYDKLRDEAIALRKLKILRFSNDEVLNNADQIQKTIKELMV